MSASVAREGPDADVDAPARDVDIASPDERIWRAVRDGAVHAFRWTVAFLPTTRLATVLVLLAPVWLISARPGGVPWALLALLVLLLVVALDIALLPARWQVSVERRVPDPLGLGDAAAGEYVLRSGVGRPLRVRLFDALPRGIDVDAARRGARTLPPRGTLALPMVLTGRVRGRWPLGPVVLRVTGRLGLVQRTLRYEPGDSVLVVPSMAGVRRFRLLSLQHRLRDAGIRAIRRRGEGTSFSNLREYAVGDDPRHIDWKATARRRKLITREYTVEQGQTVMIAIDAGRMMTQLAAGIPRFEYALSAATLLADVVVQSRDQVGLLLFDDEVRAFVPAARGREALERVRQSLIPAAATMAEPDYAAAFRVLAERHRKRSLIVLFTDVIDPRASHALLAHTARSASRHLLLVVALRNDQLMEAAMPARDASTTRLFESAAAEELVLAREEALLRMRRSGVEVLDVSPRRMTAAVINRYLEIKARSTL
ncbi:MAG TPA: DUF58 domain-containing protein [Gemmatimonadaceae bacterium]|nr:DUF58 domain-containing protein [Gemmatimonadaceae bacterium]